MKKPFDVEEITTETLKDIFKESLEGFSKTVRGPKSKYPHDKVYTISKGELIITDLIDGPYKPSAISWIASETEIWSFFNTYATEMQDYYESLGK